MSISIFYRKKKDAKKSGWYYELEANQGKRWGPFLTRQLAVNDVQYAKGLECREEKT